LERYLNDRREHLQVLLEETKNRKPGKGMFKDDIDKDVENIEDWLLRSRKSISDRLV